jgi:hypothetical protein
MTWQILDAKSNEMRWGRPDYFGRLFDWIIPFKGIIKNKEIPETIYIKTDYLPRFVNEILPDISTEFILISNCSDYSPYVNFKKEHDIIVESPHLKLWYCRNNLSIHPKMRCIPGGLDSMPEHVVSNLLTKRPNVVKHASNKILCLWRNREYNDCGKEFITRDKTKEFVLTRPDIFDWIGESMDQNAFHNLLSKYKYILCPVGNGVDPCPKLFEAIILKTIPIIIRTINTRDIYSNELPAIMVDDFAEILEPGFLDKKYAEIEPIIRDDKIMEKLTCEYWANKIKNGK